MKTEAKTGVGSHDLLDDIADCLTSLGVLEEQSRGKHHVFMAVNAARKKLKEALDAEQARLSPNGPNA
jgi:hypothetical protein